MTLKGAAHNAFNSVWDAVIQSAPDLDVLDSVPGALPGDVVRAVARDAVTALLNGLTDNRWHLWLQGPFAPSFQRWADVTHPISLVG